MEHNHLIKIKTIFYDEWNTFYAIGKGHHVKSTGRETPIFLLLYNFLTTLYIAMISLKSFLSITGDITHNKMFREAAYNKSSEPKRTLCHSWKNNIYYLL